ncbi:MAG: ribosome-associated translation inhibitor RaiA [Gammaproteobacteria bacterium]|nr:ribosome-associated translation inhibitor RaiA [Gammaproteobacteria bacterium]
MQISFTGRNIEVTPALKSFTEEKMDRLQNRHVSKMHVTFHVENLTHIAEATAHVNGTELHASAKSEDMYSAIDLLADKLLGQINKHKEKDSDHHR